MMSDFDRFMGKFRWKKGMGGYVGVEREFFVKSLEGCYMPRSPAFLKAVVDSKWTYELSCCQVEARTVPHKYSVGLRRDLNTMQDAGRRVAQTLGLLLVSQEVGSKDMPLDVYPETRPKEIASRLTREQLQAACRITSTHIHIGARDIEHALRMYNALCIHVEELSMIGDHSDGERLRLYRIVAPNCLPPHFENAEHLFETARTRGFAKNPRDCWNLLRVSTHGTVEIRTFGATESVEEIINWVQVIQNILGEELR
jgi:gamma-glutamyl:cysteine ligase YbdK (ATP-grasp superfamily)